MKPMLDATSAVATADPEVARAAFLKALDPQWGDDLAHATRARQDNAIWVTGIDLLGAACGRADVRAGMLRILATVDGVTVKPGALDGVKTLEISMAVPAHHPSGSAVKAALAAKAGSVPDQKDLSDKEKTRQTAALKASASEVIPAHAMTLTVDAQTGALLVYTDIDLKITYDVTRVNAADYGLR